jgi:hypothetical protein
MKNAHDKSHRDVQFEAGDWVLLRLHHRSAAGITDRANAKLAPKYYGSFTRSKCAKASVPWPIVYSCHHDPGFMMYSMWFF